ncbi:amidase family protein [Nocardia pneumoniae]|uniref:amidase family protein n=1 Tax=Nocardia pneumoniae TaxID=228601 RepID=UPI0009FE2A55|nr:amidase family protein [Nocardia pneumoniae]
MGVNEICLMEATELAAKIRQKILSPVEVVDAFLDQADRINPQVNAYCFTLHERARAKAREAEAAVTSGKELGALHGVPIAIKDITVSKESRRRSGRGRSRATYPIRSRPLVAEPSA